MAQSPAAVRRILAQHFLLEHLPTAELDRLANLATTRSYQPGQSVFIKGDPGTAMMAVLRGRLRISCYSEDGREVILAVFGAGDVFGEIAMIDGGERTADAVALEPTDLLVLQRRDFLPILEQNPELALKLLMVMCERFRSTDQQLEDFNFLQLRPRLAKRLLFLSEHYGEEAAEGLRIGIRLPQHLLASMIGTSREAVNKQLRAWEESGLIDVERGRITILDRDGLEAVAAAG